MIIKFFTKAIAIIVCFERFQAERGSSKQLLFFFLWHKIKCTYGTPRQIWVKGYRPRVIFKASWPLVKKSMSTTVVQKNIYILTSPLCIFIIYQFRWQRTHFKKKSEKVPVWCQFSLHLRNTMDFLRPFLLELEKNAFPGIILCKSSMYIFMGFKELLNFRTYILKKKAVPILYLLNDIDNW